MSTGPRSVWASCAIPLLLATGGCSPTSPPASSYMASVDATAVTGEAVATRPVRGADLSLALASMPEPGGSQIGLREKVFPNGVKQDIVLAGDKSPFGDNVLSVAIQSAPLPNGSRGGVPVYPPSEPGIKAEIVARYPHVDMQILTQPRRNALGTFGLAIGRHSSGVRCIYAWQYVDDVRNPGTSSSTLGKLGSLGASTQPAAIRINMCRKDATVDDLAMAVEGLALAPLATVDRALDGSRATAAIPTRATGGGVTVASDGSLEGALTTAVRAPRQVAGASPGPDRKRLARRPKKPNAVVEESVQAQSSPTLPSAPAYGSGPRYLAPVAGASASGGGYASAPVASAYNAAYNGTSGYGSGASPMTKSLDPSLPAAAYRGPGNRAQ